MGCILTQGQLLDCQDLPIGGVQKWLLLYNFPEWQAMEAAGNITRDADGMITDIINSTGVQAYRFDVPDETALILSSPIVPIEGGIDSYDHGANFSVMKTDQLAKNNISKLRFTNAVAVVYKQSGEGEVYGDKQGMKLITNNYAPNDPNLGGIIPIELKTSDTGAKEINMPVSIFKTDAATTLALIEGLVTVGA